MVFPLPGGPQKIIEPATPRSIASRSGLPGASRCAWPANSSSVRGRMRAASGCASRAVDANSDVLGCVRSRASGPSVEPIPPAAARPRRTPARPPKKATAVSQPRLAWNSGTRLRRRDVQRHAGGQREPVPRERRDPLGQQHAEHRRGPERRRRRRARAPRLCPPASIRLAMVTPSGSLCSSTARNSRTPSRPDTRNPLAMATPSKNVCSVSPSSAEMPAAALTSVRLLAEMEVGREHVLGQVHREIARPARRAPRPATRAAPRASRRAGRPPA